MVCSISTSASYGLMSSAFRFVSVSSVTLILYNIPFTIRLISSSPLRRPIFVFSISFFLLFDILSFATLELVRITVVFNSSSFTEPFNFRHRLAEVDVNPPIVYQHIIHFEVSIFARLLSGEFDESVLKRISRFSIPYHFTRLDLPEPTEYDLEIIVRRHRIQFANEEDVFRRRHLGVRNVPDHLQDSGSRFGFAVRLHLFYFDDVFAGDIVDFLIGGDAAALEPFGAGRGGPGGYPEPVRVREGVVEYDGVGDADVLVGAFVAVADGFVEELDDVQAFYNLQWGFWELFFKVFFCGTIEVNQCKQCYNLYI